jgi:hypothetical protein
MGAIRLDMTMSLDGYVAGPDDGPDEPMGVGGFRLFNWLDKRDAPGPSGDVYAALLATRALISGRRTYELAGHWNADPGGAPRRRAARLRRSEDMTSSAGLWFGRAAKDAEKAR